MSNINSSSSTSNKNHLKPENNLCAGISSAWLYISSSISYGQHVISIKSYTSMHPIEALVILNNDWTQHRANNNPFFPFAGFMSGCIGMEGGYGGWGKMEHYEATYPTHHTHHQQHNSLESTSQYHLQRYAGAYRESREGGRV